MTRKYEVMYILDQDVEKPAEVVLKYNNILASEGKIIESNEWGLMDFSYEINHKKKGYYVIVLAETTPEAISEFKRLTGNDRKNVVRTLVLNTEEIRHYEPSTKLSKTDMTKYDEERREAKKPKFKRFNKDFKRTNKEQNVEVKVVEVAIGANSGNKTNE